MQKSSENCQKNPPAPPKLPFQPRSGTKIIIFRPLTVDTSSGRVHKPERFAETTTTGTHHVGICAVAVRCAFVWKRKRTFKTKNFGQKIALISFLLFSAKDGYEEGTAEKDMK